jgi:hypothetical protein
VAFRGICSRANSALNDAQDDFAVEVASEGAFEGLAGFVEGKDLLDVGAEFSGVEEGGDLFELGAAGVDDEEDRGDVEGVGAGGVGFSGDGDEGAAAAPAEGGEGAGEEVAADGVEDEVDIARGVFEAGGGVVDDFVGAEVAEGLEVGGGGGGEDVGAGVFGELDGVGTDAARAAVDEEALAGDEFAVFEEGLPGGEGGEGDGGGFGGGEGARCGGDVGGGEGDEFCGAAVEGEVDEGVDEVAHVEGGDVGGEGVDGAGDVVAGDGGEAWGAVGVQVGFVPGEFAGGEGGGLDADADFAGGGDGERGVFDEDLFGTTAVVEAGGFHGCLRMRMDNEKSSLVIL